MHTIGYIIESDDNVRLEYVESQYVPYFQPIWEVGVNEFNDISDVDPNDINSPDLVRVVNGSDYLYYFKTLYVPWNTTNFKISVLIDGVEGNGSFIYDGYNTFIKTRRVDSEIYTTVLKNKIREPRVGNIIISHRSDNSVTTTVRIQQEACDTRLKILNCIAFDGENETEIPVASNTFEYMFDTLTDRTDSRKQSLTFGLDVRGLRNKYFVKSIKEYVAIGEIDSTYRFMNGKWYRRQQKYVNGNFVSYYAEAVVINNIGYQLKNYDGAFYIEKLPDNSIKFTNYGRVFMEDSAFYLITLANYDDINTTCQIKITYADVPTNILIP